MSLARFAPPGPVECRAQSLAAFPAIRESPAGREAEQKQSAPDLRLQRSPYRRHAIGLTREVTSVTTLTRLQQLATRVRLYLAMAFFEGFTLEHIDSGAVDLPEIWRAWATDVRAAEIDCGPNVSEEAPEELARLLIEFLADDVRPALQLEPTV
jgi:hypothetical protein